MWGLPRFDKHDATCHRSSWSDRIQTRHWGSTIVPSWKGGYYFLTWLDACRFLELEIPSEPNERFISASKRNFSFGDSAEHLLSIFEYLGSLIESETVAEGNRGNHIVVCLPEFTATFRVRITFRQRSWKSIRCFIVESRHFEKFPPKLNHCAIIFAHFHEENFVAKLFSHKLPAGQKICARLVISRGSRQ